MNLKQLAAATAFAGIALTMSASMPYSPLPLPAGAHHPVISPDGTTLLYSTDIHSGLNALNMRDMTITTIDEGASAGFEPIFSTDSKTVYYRTAELVDGLMYRDVRSFNLEGKTQRKLSALTRDKVEMPSLVGGDYAVADYKTVKTVRNGEVKNINPLPDSHSYLWASLSSDGNNLIFCEPFQGVFIARADGSDARRLLAKGDYPSWAGKNRIVAVVTHDDGYQILDSKLVCVNIVTGQVTDLTPDDVKVSEATASETGLVVFSDLNGNMYTLNLNAE